MKKPLIIGMNNPLSRKPGHALYPDPPGCTGWRLWQMLLSRVPGVTRRDYLRAFDRRNLVVGEWDAGAARGVAMALVEGEELDGRTVVLLGNDVRHAFRLGRLLIHPVVGHYHTGSRFTQVTWRQLPHPSGRNLWYNDEGNRAAAALLLEELYHESRGLAPGAPEGGRGALPDDSAAAAAARGDAHLALGAAQDGGGD